MWRNVYAYFLDESLAIGFTAHCTSLAVATIKALTLWIATAGKQPPFRMFGCYVFLIPLEMIAQRYHPVFAAFALADV